MDEVDDDEEEAEEEEEGEDEEGEEEAFAAAVVATPPPAPPAAPPLALTGAPNPIDAAAFLSATCASSPTNAPPATKRILLVSTCTTSPLGFFLPPFSGTFITAPSSILSKACWTPSPETSRVMEGLSAPLRPILSTSSM